MFEVNGEYSNRKGNYTVVSITGARMVVRYKDGTEEDLKMNIQERIWENILAEEEAAAAKQKKKTKKHGAKVKFFIKTVSMAGEDDFAMPSLKRRQAVSLQDGVLSPGDRLLYYAIEARQFFAVTTITAAPKKGKARDFMFGDDLSVKVHLHPIDIDAHVVDPKIASSADSTELEIIADQLALLTEKDKYIGISEDDFELVAELVMESDAAAEDMQDDDDEDEIEDEDVADSILGIDG